MVVHRLSQDIPVAPVAQSESTPEQVLANQARETVLDVIEAIGGTRAFWDRDPALQPQINPAAARVLTLVNEAR